MTHTRVSTKAGIQGQRTQDRWDHGWDKTHGRTRGMKQTKAEPRTKEIVAGTHKNNTDMWRNNKKMGWKHKGWLQRTQAKAVSGIRTGTQA